MADLLQQHAADPFTLLGALPPLIVDIGTAAGVGVAVLTFTAIVLGAVTRAVKHVVQDELAPLREEVRQVKDDVGEIRTEVTTNSGGSLKDAVARIERAQTQQIADGP